MSTMWASVLLKLTSFQSPLLRAVVPCAAAAFAIQGLAGAPSVLFQTERLFDISGSLTFLSVGALSLYLPALRAKALALVNGAAVVPSLPTLRQLLTDSASAAVAARNWRQLALTALVVIWATRLGSYLFTRVMADGSDSRFDEIRGNPKRFSGVFLMQAVWVMIPLLPVIAINAVPAATLATALPRVAWHDALGFGAWVVGFYFEVVADYQKSQWSKQKKLKQHDEEFLTSGLFSKCRYPHYFGEITMWTGISTVAASILCRKPIQLALGLSGGPVAVLGTTTLSYVSPFFITLLLTKGSGIPMSEPKYDKKFGDRKDYQEWRQNTPRLIPKLF